MKKLIYITLILFSFLSVQKIHANHTAGADLTYVCLGGNQYQVNLNLYVDCKVLNNISAQQTIYFSSPCGSLPSMQIDLLNPGGTEISQLCPAQINNSSCNGGALPGMLVYHYTGTVTLTPVCNSWTISWWNCCRNAAIINLQTSSSGTYLEATINSVIASCNNSPSFTAQPIPYVCANQPVNYNFGVSETDGDSLYYSFVNAMAAGPTTILYASGYSATTPIPGITIDPKTGLLKFTPITIGSFVIVVMVQEYDNNGNLKGSVTRDIQFVVQSCPNIVPDPAGNISKVVNANQTGSHSIEVCEGSSFTFKTTYTDADAGDLLTLLSDINTLFPGATITTTGSNPVVATISWKAPTGSANTNGSFNITVDDGSCPVPGQQMYSYNIKILPSCPKDTSMLFVPNVFTPGGANPLFVIGNYGITTYSIQIFDRWGSKVFESGDITINWNGNNVSDGTYYYLIKAKGVDKKEYDEKGFVHRIGTK